MSQSTLNWIFHAVSLLSLSARNFPFFPLTRAHRWLNQYARYGSSLLVALFCVSRLPFSVENANGAQHFRQLCDASVRMFFATFHLHRDVRLIRGYSIVVQMGIGKFGKSMCFACDVNKKMLRKYLGLVLLNLWQQMCTDAVRNTAGEKTFAAHRTERRVCILNAMSINRWNLLKAVAVSNDWICVCELRICVRGRYTHWM